MSDDLAAEIDRAAERQRLAGLSEPEPADPQVDDLEDAEPTEA